MLRCRAQPRRCVRNLYLAELELRRFAGALFSGTLWFGNAAYGYLSVSFIQMLKALMPAAVYLAGLLWVCTYHFCPQSLSHRQCAPRAPLIAASSLAVPSRQSYARQRPRANLAPPPVSPFDVFHRASTGSIGGRSASWGRSRSA